MALVCCGCHRRADAIYNSNHQVCNSIYHWKTTYNPTEYEKQWLKENDVHRIYVRMFDVDNVGWYQDIRIEPSATTVFIQDVINEDMEYVPTIYITLDALLYFDECGGIEKYADKIIKRALNMADYYSFPKVKELQIDCDWTPSTQDDFFRLCECMRDSLHQQNILLSSTIRLHQLKTQAPPVDCGVLMLYNIGNLKDYRTENSIITPQMIKPYLCDFNYTLPLDVALPTFSWGACFREGKFGCIVRNTDYSDSSRFEDLGSNHFRLKYNQDIDGHYLWADDEIRLETCMVDSILAAKKLLPKQLQQSGIIIYHLDSTNLSMYNHDEITEMYRISK